MCRSGGQNAGTATRAGASLGVLTVARRWAGKPRRYLPPTTDQNFSNRPRRARRVGTSSIAGHSRWAPNLRPFAVRFARHCGPSAVQIPANIPEPPRIPPSPPSSFGGISPVFVAIRGSTEYRGERLDLAWIRGIRGLCNGFATAIPVEAGHRAESCPLYAIVNARTAPATGSRKTGPS
jgi:hypothetical protein